MRQLNFLKKWEKVDDKKKSSTEEFFRLNSLHKQRISWNCYTCSNKQMSNNHTCVVDANGLKSCSGFLMALDVLFKIPILGRGSMEL
jgi:hypothetical protein